MAQNRVEIERHQKRKELIEVYQGRQQNAKIEIAGVSLEPKDVARLNEILDGKAQSSTNDKSSEQQSYDPIE